MLIKEEKFSIDSMTTCETSKVAKRHQHQLVVKHAAKRKEKLTLEVTKK